MKANKAIFNGNQAAAYIAHKVNEACVIYPITPSSEMSELVEKWSANGQKNIYGGIPEVTEMQSEAGVAGALHGLCQTGTLATTFTASQGLLLMMPNMFRMAGELSSNVIHVATRSVATHALSVFGDHSDIMAVRSTGYAFLGASSVQEAMDFALIAQAATLESRIPFLHFFDGFRTSHEFNTIEIIDDKIINRMINRRSLTEFRNNALNPDSPCIRGTAQGPDTFFQGREASNPFYAQCANIVSKKMEIFEQLTGRAYQPFDYVGHPKATRVVIAMGSSCQTLEQSVRYLNDKGERTGLINVRLYRPFSAKYLIKSLPPSCRKIAVLDRCKEAGSSAEPLCLDVMQAINSQIRNPKNRPLVIGGRYGLASKEFTPAMACAVFDELKKELPLHGFSLGIEDDLGGTSLQIASQFSGPDHGLECLIINEKNEKNRFSLETLRQQLMQGTDQYVQSYTECDYKKAHTTQTTHLRISQEPVKAAYLIHKADLIAIEGTTLLEKHRVLERLKPGGRLLIFNQDAALPLTDKLKTKQIKQIHNQQIRLFECFNKEPSFNLNEITEDTAPLYRALLPLIKNLKDHSVISVVPEQTPEPLSGNQLENGITCHSQKMPLAAQLVAGNGHNIPVSAFPPDGGFESGTSHLREKETAAYLPDWDMEACTQCGACSMACPLAALRAKIFDPAAHNDQPEDFGHITAKISGQPSNITAYTIQVNPDRCDSCNHCVEACDSGALSLKQSDQHGDKKKDHWKFFDSLPETDPALLDRDRIDHLALMEPLFKYPDSDQGCGQAAYLRILSQLFGDRMLVANATGSSSIFGGALPTTPWSVNSEGRGPAWSNSLFEDNAEFGLGFRISLDQKKKRAAELIREMKQLPEFLELEALLSNSQGNNLEIKSQRQRVGLLKDYLRNLSDPKAQELYQLADHLVEKSVWIVGGDGWAYDVGFGGLDHAVSTGRNINILILDNEVYDNTGGQLSKSTPKGAIARFASKGNKARKKDLGRMLMAYEDVYVASVALGADRNQTLKTLVEAESFDGPSVILAYCHSPSHGIDIQYPGVVHKAMVRSGRWILYRRDPRRSRLGLAPMQLDSSSPDLPLEEYICMEQRFRPLMEENQKNPDTELSNMQQALQRRYDDFVRMSRETAHKDPIMQTDPENSSAYF